MLMAECTASRRQRRVYNKTACHIGMLLTRIAIRKMGCLLDDGFVFPGRDPSTVIMEAAPITRRPLLRFQS